MDLETILRITAYGVLGIATLIVGVWLLIKLDKKFHLDKVYSATVVGFLGGMVGSLFIFTCGGLTYLLVEDKRPPSDAILALFGIITVAGTLIGFVVGVIKRISGK